MLEQSTAVRSNQDRSPEKELVRAFVRDVWDRGKFDTISLYLDPLYFERWPTPESKQCCDVDPIQFVRTLRNALPDIRFHILQMIAENSKVAIHFAGFGTQTGELLGIPPTGSPVDVIGAAIFQIRQEKILSIDLFADDGLAIRNSPLQALATVSCLQLLVPRATPSRQG